jgi:hypothetical protein
VCSCMHACGCAGILCCWVPATATRNRQPGLRVTDVVLSVLASVVVSAPTPMLLPYMMKGGPWMMLICWMVIVYEVGRLISGELPTRVVWPLLEIGCSLRLPLGFQESCIHGRR